MPEFSSENQPKNRKGRGPSERTKILEAMKRKGITEDGFYDLLVERSLSPDDSFALKELLSRFSPLKKSVMPDVEFEFNKEGTPVQQVSQLLDAISQSKVPPDVGVMLITAIKNAIDIEVNTELKERIEKLEAMIGG